MTQLDQLHNVVIVAEKFEAPGGVIETPGFKLGRSHWLLLALAALCLLFITFLSVAKSIQITTLTPRISKPDQLVLQAAQVKLNSWIKLPLGNRVLLLPGTHLVTAIADGYSVLTQTIEVGGDRHQQFELILSPLPGQLEIDLTPAVAAKFLLNGQAFGDLPGLLRDIPAGQHEITVDAPLYRSASRSIIVQGRGLTERIAITLDPAWGTLNLNSQPPAATVLIDEKEVGKTPLQIKVEEGAHTLALQAEKFKPYRQDFTLFAQQDLLVPKITLTPADGVLEINTRPGEAAVILNGEYQGLSPISLNIKPDQPQQLRVYKAGFHLEAQQIVLSPAQNQAQEINLQQDLVAVKFSISPKDAVLYVDGVQRGRGTQTLELNTLPHRISVRKAGYSSYQNDIIPTKSSNQIVSVHLLTKEQHFWANVPERYVTVAGQAMQLFRSPGKVKLGSSRRENGRRSNETQYTAQLNKHFYVSLHEVTNKEFRAFKASHNSGNYKRNSLDSAKHPVVNVSWQQSALYCNWLSQRERLSPFYQTKSGYVSGLNTDANGYRLLTEVEWAWLARNKGAALLTYPWDESIDPADLKPSGNFADTSAAAFIAFTLGDYNDGYKATSPVGKFPANHRGLYDLEGNVSEWVNDWYSANSDYSAAAPTLIDPLGPDEGEFHVIRGASWARGHLPQLRLAYRDFGAAGKHDVGFRIARYVGKPE